jgi:hypothetical protein
MGLAERPEEWHETYLRPKGKRVKVGSMADILNLAVLIGGSVGSLAFGVLAAYGILRVGFALISPRPRRVAVNVQAEVAL